MLRTRSRSWLALAAAGFMAATLAGCSGDDGAAGPTGPTGPQGPSGPTGPQGPAAVKTVDLATIAAADWESAKFKSSVTKVTVAGKPVVEFTLTNAAGDPVVGLEKVTSKSSTATAASYPNISFALAKLVPRDAAPSKWVSYIVTTVPSTTTAATMTRPSTDNTGTLEAVANKPGSYKYTFYRDVTAVKAFVAANAASAVAANANNRAADLGDLTYDANLPHRLTIQIGGAAPGTGSNTPTGATVTPTVNLADAVNVVYDFIPATGAVATAAQMTREDVDIATCNVCHDKLAFHGGSARVETKYCVVCHTEQRAYGQAKAVSTDGKFPALTETASKNAVTGITSYSYSPSTYVADGEVAGNFVTMIHKIHNGAELVKENYNYANVAFNNKGFSKLGGGQRMCTSCHAGPAATNADNFKKLPSREACGACHDGINFATGSGSTLADKAAASTVGAIVARSGHPGTWTDDKACALCHTAEAIGVVHRMENITKNNPQITDGLASFTYEIKSAKVNATTNDVTIEFGIKQRIAPSTEDKLVKLTTPAAGVSVVLDGFTGGPSFLLAYAMGQDGIAAADMVDYNNLGRASAQPISVSIVNLLNTNNAATLGTIAESTANPGYYIATIKGTSTSAFPVGARLRSVSMQAYFTQTTAPATPTATIARHAIAVVKAVDGDTVRRTVVDDEKCANCHEWFEGHGGNRVKETQVCVVCHVPGLATSGRGIADSFWTSANGITATSAKSVDKIIKDWKFDKTLPNAALKLPVVTNNFKEMIHGIHAGRERVTPFADARDRTPSAIAFLDFRRMDFPGRLANCEDCHASSDSSTTKTYNSIPMKALVTTDESVNAAYAAGIAGGTATTAQAKASLSTANDTDVVSTPFAGACASCHDNAATKSHIQINGGVINGTRAAAKLAVESCAVCHGPGSDYDTAVVHKR